MAQWLECWTRDLQLVLGSNHTLASFGFSRIQRSCCMCTLDGERLTLKTCDTVKTKQPGKAVADKER